MQITAVRALPLDAFLLVKIETDAGLYGLGEATIRSRPRAVVEALNHLEPLLVGQDATRIEHIWQDIFRGTFWRGGPVLQAALAGIDIALWDLAGKALGVPCYRLLGGAAREKVRIYRHTGGPTPEALVEHARGLLAEGCTVLRISPTDVQQPHFEPGPAIRKAREHFGALREAIGEEVEVIFEAHTRFTPARAIELCKAIEPFNPVYIEDPIRSENASSLRLLRQHTSLPIGTGEQWHSKWQFREAIEADLIDYARVDLCRVAGITEGKKIAAMCETHYQDLATHYTAGIVNGAASFHLNMAIPNCYVQEYAPPADWHAAAVPGGPEVVDGFLIPNDRPGLGVTLDEEALARMPGTTSEPPHWRREDGSVQDW